MSATDPVIGHCRKCKTEIRQSHPYVWCDVCKDPITDEVNRKRKPEPEATPTSATHTSNEGAVLRGPDPLHVPDVIGRCLWLVVAIMAGWGLLNFMMVRYTVAEISAPQLAGLAAESLTWALIPYVIARAWDEIWRPLRRPSQ